MDRSLPGSSIFGIFPGKSSGVGLPFPSPTQYAEPRLKTGREDFPGGPVAKHPPSKAGDMDSVPGWKLRPTCHRATREPTYSNY